MAEKTSYEDLKRKVSSKRTGKSSYEELVEKVAQKRYSEDVKNVDDSYINSFLEDSSNFLSSSQKKLDGMTWSSAMDSYDREDRNATMSDLGYRAKLIGYYLENNKNKLDKDTYSKLSTALSEYQTGFTKADEAFENANKFYSQWDTELDYTRWDKYHGKNSSELTDMLKDMEDGEEKDWLIDYSSALRQAEEDEKKWNELTGGYDPEKDREAGKAGWDAYVAQQERNAQKSQNAEKKEKTFWDYFAMAGEGRDTSLPVHLDTNEMAEEAQRKDAQLSVPDDRWSDEQREIYGYLWTSQREKAKNYARAVNNQLNLDAEMAQVQENCAVCDHVAEHALIS